MTYFDSACQYHSPQVACVARHNVAAPLQFIVCTAWGRLGRRDNHAASRVYSAVYRVLHFALPLPHSPCRVLLATASPQTVQIVIIWTAPFTDRSSEKVSHRVSRPKKISPDNDTTQYMQISPSSQYPNTGIIRTLVSNGSLLLMPVCSDGRLMHDFCMNSTCGIFFWCSGLACTLSASWTVADVYSAGNVSKIVNFKACRHNTVILPWFFILFHLKAMLSPWKPCDVAVNFDMYQNLQWHRTVLPAIAQLSCLTFLLYFIGMIMLSVCLSICIWQCMVAK